MGVGHGSDSVASQKLIPLAERLRLPECWYTDSRDKIRYQSRNRSLPLSNFRWRSTSIRRMPAMNFEFFVISSDLPGIWAFCRFRDRSGRGGERFQNVRDQLPKAWSVDQPGHTFDTHLNLTMPLNYDKWNALEVFINQICNCIDSKLIFASLAIWWFRHRGSSKCRSRIFGAVSDTWLECTYT